MNRHHASTYSFPPRSRYSGSGGRAVPPPIGATEIRCRNAQAMRSRGVVMRALARRMLMDDVVPWKPLPDILDHFPHINNSQSRNQRNGTTSGGGGKVKTSSRSPIGVDASGAEQRPSSGEQTRNRQAAPKNCIPIPVYHSHFEFSPAGGANSSSSSSNRSNVAIEVHHSPAPPADAKKKKKSYRSHVTVGGKQQQRQAEAMDDVSDTVTYADVSMRGRKHQQQQQRQVSEEKQRVMEEKKRLARQLLDQLLPRFPLSPMRGGRHVIQIPVHVRQRAHDQPVQPPNTNILKPFYDRPRRRGSDDFISPPPLTYNPQQQRVRKASPQRHQQRAPASEAAVEVEVKNVAARDDDDDDKRASIMKDVNKQTVRHPRTTVAAVKLDRRSDETAKQDDDAVDERATSPPPPPVVVVQLKQQSEEREEDEDAGDGVEEEVDEFKRVEIIVADKSNKEDEEESNEKTKDDEEDKKDGDDDEDDEVVMVVKKKLIDKSTSTEDLQPAEEEKAGGGGECCEKHPQLRSEKNVAVVSPTHQPHSTEMLFSPFESTLVAKTSPLSKEEKQAVVSLAKRKLSGRSDGDARPVLSKSACQQQDIPKFYFPRGKPVSDADELKSTIKKISKVFNDSGKERLTQRELIPVANACGLTSYWKSAIFKASVVADDVSTVTKDQVISMWQRIAKDNHDDPSKFIAMLAKPGNTHLDFDDFLCLLVDIVECHPGLLFLREAPEFHTRYINTVVARIFYVVNRSWSGQITLPELRKSKFLQVLDLLSEENDINAITEYFSYEHFYVVYCKFWELDTDHDLIVDKFDLARHANGALPMRLIERLLCGAVTRWEASDHRQGKMSYVDFVWFLISEEDKTTPTSIEYWFRCMDLDGDGYISMYEMEYFYEEQVRKLEQLEIEPLPFEDCVCQMLDMVKPTHHDRISLSDLKQCKLAKIFFDTFFNIEKYLEHEQKDPFAPQKEGDVNEPSDWVRYAMEEYELLVAEEHANDQQISLDVSYNDETDSLIKEELANYGMEQHKRNNNNNTTFVNSSNLYGSSDENLGISTA